MAGLGRERSHLLSNDQYDDDAPDVDASTRRPGEDEHEDDDDSLDGRTIRNSAEYDHEVFEDDYEGQGTGTRQGGPAGGRKDYTSLKADSRDETHNIRKARRADRKFRKRRRREGESELVYEMEEGGPRGSSEEDERKSIDSMAEADLKLLGDTTTRKSGRRKTKIKLALHGGVLVLFLLFVWLAYNATRSTKASSLALQVISNGTALFAPTTIIISLDGFRADFLQRDLTPTLNGFIATGISPRWMLPSFPSVTFPNHYTMATGMYPEAHGIVGNTFWDPDMQDEFYYTNNSIAHNPKWWGGEPFWVTAEKQGIRSAIHMWPGSEAHIGGIEPSNVDVYDGGEELESKVNKILRYLDLPGQEHEGFAAMANHEQRAQLIAAYVPVVDRDGHNYGPNSTEINETISKVDNMLALLFNRIQERNLTHIVNVIITSDHGMATTDVTRMLQFDDLLDVSKIQHIDGWPLYGLRPTDPNDLASLHQQLLESTKDNPNVEVYLRDEDMPERYHFSNNQRIAPLWLVPKAGWAIVTKEEFDIEDALKTGAVYHPRGLHGYDHEHPLMRAIFVAHGPAFPHTPGSRMEVFRKCHSCHNHEPEADLSIENTEVYNILCDSLGLTPAPNNGTLRLPLKPTGLHSDADTIQAEIPSDPPIHSLTNSSMPAPASPTLADVSANGTDIMASTTLPWAGASTDPADGEKEEEDGDGKKLRIGKIWQWLTDKVNGVKEWAHGLFHGDDKDDKSNVQGHAVPQR